MHKVDEVLADLDLNIKRRVRASHWLNPIDPAAYRRVTPRLLERIDASGTKTHPVERGAPPADDALSGVSLRGDEPPRR
jgi:hypothetical protein